MHQLAIRFIRFFLPVLFLLCWDISASEVKVELVTNHHLNNPTIPNSKIPIALVIDLKTGWHIYAPKGEHAEQAPKIEFNLPSGFTLSSWKWPPAKRIKSEVDEKETYLGYTGKVVLVATLKPNDPTFLKKIPKAKVSFVLCKQVCQFFEKDIKLTEVSNQSFNDIITPKKVLADTEEISWWWVIIYALLGGLILNLMPCVLPVLSLKILGLAQNNTPKQIRVSGLAFTMGTFITFWLMTGLLIMFKSQGEAIGWGFQLQSPIFVFLLMSLFMAIALNLFGVFEIGLSLTKFSSGSNNNEHSLFSASFFSGFLAVIVASPCSAPFMGVALGYALTQGSFMIFTVMTALALGFALPFLILCLVPAWSRFLPKPGRWMVTLRHIMGFSMFGAVLWLMDVFVSQTGDEQFFVLSVSILFIAIGLWVYGRWGCVGITGASKVLGYLVSIVLLIAAISLPILSIHGERNQKKHIVKSLTWEPFSEKIIDAYMAQEKTVFIDFTASWCITCQWNKKMILNTPDVVDLFEREHIIPVRADWTNRDSKITEALRLFGRSSIPVYVILKPGKKPIILPEILSFSKLKKFLSQS